MRCEGMPSVSGVVALVVVVAGVGHYTTTHLPQVLHSLTPTSCLQECADNYFAGTKGIRNTELLPLLREKYLHPPPASPDLTGYDIYRPAWRELLNWYGIQETFKELWEDQAPGVFVEVGAVDGEFMSQTLMLEKNLSWTGLLIEPDPRSFRILQERRRNAWTAPVCIHYGPPSVLLWLRNLIDGLPQELQSLVMARSKLASETVIMDQKQGKNVYVTCLPLSSVLLAANMTQIDLLAVATGSDADHRTIRDVVLNREAFDVKTLLIQYPRSYILDNPYPIVPGYINDMERSQLLVRFYWRTAHCRLLQRGTCIKAKHYDLVDACKKYLCLGFATVWTFDMDAGRVTVKASNH
ncbi:uncharacterized protein [Procambarus clarkii]|uniref:uncharacterized protein isoform X2 n=1 Tax=Procambarus clarkii TaxID=6728 RepID=UPI003742E068